MSPSASRRLDSSRSSRRQLLAGIGALSLCSLSGCGAIDPFDGSGGEGDTIEILVENATGDPARIAVSVTDREGNTLFSRVYELEPGHIDSAGEIETRPATVTVFTPDGTSATWEYAPENDPNCEGEDIGITLKSAGTIESWYAC